MQIRSVLVMLTWTLVPSSARAIEATPTFDLERSTFNPGARETMSLSTADLLEPRRLRLFLGLNYSHRPLVLSVDGVRVGALVSGRFTTHLVGAYALAPWVELSLQLPFVVQGGDDLRAYGVAPVATAALGSPRLEARFAFARQDRGGPLDVGASAAVTLPLGSEIALTKEPGLGFAFTPKLAFGRAFGPMRVGAEVGVHLRSPRVLSLESARISDEVGSQLLGGVVLSSTRALSRLRGEITFRGAVPFTRTPLSAEVLGGLRWALTADDTWELFGIGGPGLGREPGTPAFRVMFGLAWAPSFAEERERATPLPGGTP